MKSDVIYAVSFRTYWIIYYLKKNNNTQKSDVDMMNSRLFCQHYQRNKLQIFFPLRKFYYYYKEGRLYTFFINKGVG